MTRITKIARNVIGYHLLLGHIVADSLIILSTSGQSQACYKRTAEAEAECGVLPRRSCIHMAFLSAGCILSSTLSPQPASASETKAELLKPITDARKVLQNLLDKWEASVVDCTYADVPRDLLEQKNKELLLEKASTYALFDKSVSVVSCKTSNKKIRDYLGRTGVGPLVGLDKNLRKAIEVLDDPNRFDEFIQASENLQQALSKADSLSYAAGVADFNAVNNFDKESIQTVLGSNNQLAETKRAIADAVQYLDQILSILDI